MQILLGQKCRDVVSGFTGIAVARTEWMNGCTRVTLQPPVNKEGALPEGQAFDEPNLMVVLDTPRKNANSREGGPRPPATRAPDPKR